VQQKDQQDLNRSSQSLPKPSWKEEVNRRLEAHKSRKGLSVVDQPSNDEQQATSARAAMAARVAARFSNAPSYSEMQAAEARAALHDAEVATRAALEAQVVAQEALANLERAAEHGFDYERAAQATVAVPQWQTEEQSLEDDSEAASSHAAHSPELSPESSPEPFYAAPFHGSAHSPVSDRPAVSHSDDAVHPRTVEAQPIHGNVIHFPREIVATRRMRPRLTGCEPSTQDQTGQLSIFEVDPSTISIEPTASTVETTLPAPSWSGPEWSALELDVEPELAEEFDGGPPSISVGIDLAPLELRLMAATIDFALILVLVCAMVAGVAGHLTHSPSMKIAEICAAAALLFGSLLYQAFFLITMTSTPGMMYAGIAFCTFDDERPTRAQLRKRVTALLASVLPIGLGIAWSIFDEDHLSWHDRISRTYQRSC
jgi:uncharacterized RDD family membrane protein YckC